jgi:hypothetical protein
MVAEGAGCVKYPVQQCAERPVRPGKIYRRADQEPVRIEARLDKLVALIVGLDAAIRLFAAVAVKTSPHRLRAKLKPGGLDAVFIQNFLRDLK